MSEELESKLDTYEAVKLKELHFRGGDPVEAIFKVYDAGEVVGLIDDLIEAREEQAKREAELLKALEYAEGKLNDLQYDLRNNEPPYRKVENNVHFISHGIRGVLANYNKDKDKESQ